MSKGLLARIVAALVLGIFAVAIGVSWWLDSQEIRYVLPNGFRGGFIIMEDPHGTDLGWQFNRKFVVHVPHSRVVKVKSFSPIKRMHSQLVQVGESGAIVPVDLARNDTVQLRGGSIGNQAVNGVAHPFIIWYVFGTAAELETFDPWSLFPKIGSPTNFRTEPQRGDSE